MDDKSKQNAPLQPEDKGTNEDSKEDNSDLHPRIKQLTDKVHEKDEEIAQLRQEMDEVKTAIAKRQQDTGDDELSPEEKASLARIKKGLLEEGFATKDDINVTQRATLLGKMADKHNGEDGLPKFVQTDVVAFAKANGFDVNSQVALEAAYKTLHAEAIAQKSGNGQIVPPSSESPTKQERQEGNKLTPEQISMMNDEEYEKNREAILASMKPPRTIIE